MGVKKTTLQFANKKILHNLIFGNKFLKFFDKTCLNNNLPPKYISI